MIFERQSASDGDWSGVGEPTKTESDRFLFFKQRQLVSHLANQAQTHHYTSAVADCSGDQKRLFQIINKLLNKKKDQILPSKVSDQDLANRFSDFIMNKVSNIRRILDTRDSTGYQCQKVPLHIYV